MIPNRNSICAVALLTVLLALPPTAFLNAATAAKHAPRAQPGAFQKVMSHYATLKSYQATINTTTILKPTNGSQPNTINSVLKIAYKAPNLVRVDSEGLMGGGTAVSNGTTTVTYSAMTNQYSSGPAPKDPLAALLNPFKGAAAPSLVGRANLGGKLYDQYKSMMRMHGATVTALIYVDPSTQLIQRLVMQLPQLPGAQGGKFKMSMQEDYTSQKLNPTLPAGMFQFTPPKGAQRSSGAGMPSILGIPGSPTP